MKFQSDLCLAGSTNHESKSPSVFCFYERRQREVLTLVYIPKIDLIFFSPLVISFKISESRIIGLTKNMSLQNRSH